MNPRAVFGRGRRRLQRIRLERRMAGRRLLRTFARCYPRAFFVEIGANDGEQHDHLRPFILRNGWQGIMVEPVPYIFERLRRNYGAVDGVALENAAIADRNGRLPFYSLRKPAPEELDDLPDWYDGVGSFSRDSVLSHVDHIPDIETRIVCDEVPAMTFDALLEKHSAAHVDLVVIDTEGYDAEILRSIDFSRKHPRLVVYEHYHLDPDELEECRSRLHEFGYETLEEGFDTFCLDTRYDDRLTRTWRRVRPAVPPVTALADDAR